MAKSLKKYAPLLSCCKHLDKRYLDFFEMTNLVFKDFL